MSTLYCPECYEPVWDLPHGSKLAKCWNAEGHDGDTLAFDTMDMDEGDVRLTGKPTDSQDPEKGEQS